MISQPEYEHVLKAVSGWPAEQRLALAHELLSALRGPNGRRPPRRTLDRALGLARTDTEAPSDEQVRAWIDEHRRDKYGA